jgi:lysophospholipase L1-like esterase
VNTAAPAGKGIIMKTVTGIVIAAAAAASAGAAGDARAAPLSPRNHFEFGTGKAGVGITVVAPETPYTRERGYGFEEGAASVRAEKDHVTSDGPFTFSVAVPEGNYRVTVVLGGDPRVESVTTVKAEVRRLMLERVRTAPGRTAKRTFTVNVRTPRIAGGGEVRLKTRERTAEGANWDDKLTLQFSDARPCVRSIEITPAPPTTPTVFLLGDSTVCDQPGAQYGSWGQMLPRFFSESVAVANHAQSGESLRSASEARRLDKVLGAMKPGDYLFIQFGHNDQKEKGKDVGAFTTYKADLKRFVAGAKAKGGIPVLVTPVARRRFDAEGKVVESLGDYPEAMRQAAQEEGVTLIDLNAMSKPFYEALGPRDSLRAFAPGDGTHHNDYGSYELAKCVVTGIRQNRLGLTKHLAGDVPPFDPSRPDPVDAFALPPDAWPAAARPLGN